jgi:tRNA-splicing endonuclease subunit Sen54
MAFDDDDNPSTLAQPAKSTNGAATEDVDDDAPDVNLFLSMFDKHGVSSKAIRKGEKDFESHGTRAQDGLLEASRTVLDNVLGYTRIHREDSWVRGWCFPDWWAKVEEAGEKEGLWLRDRKILDGRYLHTRSAWVRGKSGFCLRRLFFSSREGPWISGGQIDNWRISYPSLMENRRRIWDLTTMMPGCL